MSVDDTPDGNSQPVDTCQMRTNGGRMALQLKRPGWCVNTSESGPNPDKEGYVNTTPIDPAAVDRIRDYLRGAESRVCDVMDQPESAAFHYFSGAATAARACLVYLGADD